MGFNWIPGNKAATRMRAKVSSIIRLPGISVQICIIASVQFSTKTWYLVPQLAGTRSIIFTLGVPVPVTVPAPGARNQVPGTPPESLQQFCMLYTILLV